MQVRYLGAADGDVAAHFMDGPEHALGVEGGLGDEFALCGAVATLGGFAAVGVSGGGRLRRAEGGGREQRE